MEIIDLSDRFREKIFVPGRGTTLIIECRDCPVKISDEITVNGKRYTITGIEGKLDNFGKFRGPFGLVVREIQ